jgi:hypothetical protein
MDTLTNTTTDTATADSDAPFPDEIVGATAAAMQKQQQLRDNIAQNDRAFKRLVLTKAKHEGIIDQQLEMLRILHDRYDALEMQYLRD